MAHSRWTGVTRRVEPTICQSCSRPTQYLFKGYAVKVFRLDPIRTSYSTFLLGNVVRLVEAKVCQRCQELNQPKPTELPKPGCQHCDCAPRYTCCYCKEGQENLKI